MEKFEDTKIGPTGIFPAGKLDKTDEGELNISVYVLKDRIIMQFGKPIKWLGLDKPSAIAFVDILKKKIGELE